MTNTTLIAVLQDRSLTVERLSASTNAVSLTTAIENWIHNEGDNMVTDAGYELVFNHEYTAYPTGMTAVLQDRSLTVERL